MNKIFNITATRKIWYGASVFLTVICLIGAVFGGVRLGIDFTGGTLFEIATKNTITTETISGVYSDLGVEINRVTPSGSGGVLIRSKPINQEKKGDIVKKLKEKTGQEIEERSFETIGPTVSTDLIRKSILSIIFASLALIAYLAFSFRKASRIPSWRFGVVAIFTLLHDAALAAGVYMFVGRFTGYEIDALFVSALLTVMSFSVHDTIVVFDRIREYLSEHPGADLAEAINLSITSTVARSLNTSLTIIVVLLTLFLLGASSISGFVLTLLVGIFIGTYSSIFIASPLLLTWEVTAQKGKQRKAKETK